MLSIAGMDIADLSSKDVQITNEAKKVVIVYTFTMTLNGTD